MRIKEPPERHVTFLYVWAALFGGIPLAMLPVVLAGGGTFNGEPTSQADPAWMPVALVLLFPTIAGIVLAFVLRRQLRAGFRFAADGIHGAHDAEDMTIPWSEVSAIGWEHVGPTTSVEVNGSPLPSGPAVHAWLHDGRSVRLMQRVAHNYRWQTRIEAQLRAAAAAGAIPVPVRSIAEAVRASGHAPAPPDGVSDAALDDLLSPGRDDADDSPDDVPAWPTTDA